MGNVIWHANKMLPRIMQRGSRRRRSRSSNACCTRSQDVADMWQEQQQEDGEEQEQPLSSQVFAHVVQMKLKFALTV